MAQKTVYHVLHKTPDETARLTEESTEDKEKREKHYCLECQITNDGRMVIRMWEYDTAMALERIQKKNGKYHIYYPHSCVLQLRGKHRFDKMKLVAHMPDGRTFTYSVPVIWLSDYTSDKIFQKHLLFLLPFYIIKYEKKIHRLEKDKDYLDKMLAEYRRIEQYLNKELLEKNREFAYRYMIALINRIADYVMRDSKKSGTGGGKRYGWKGFETGAGLFDGTRGKAY